MHFDYDYNEAMANAARGGHKEIVELMMEKGADDYNKAMEQAVCASHVEIVDLLAGKVDDNFNFNTALAYSAREGHMDMVEYIIRKVDYNFNYNNSFIDAARGGHIGVVNFFLENVDFDYDYNNAMAFAAHKGNSDIVNLMIERGADNYNIGAIAATRGGHGELLKLMLKKGANNYSKAMAEALSIGNRDIVNLIFTERIGERYKALIDPLIEDSYNIIHLMGIEGAEVFNLLIICAASIGDKEMVEEMMGMVAVDYDYSEVLAKAAYEGHKEIINFLLENENNDYDYNKAMSMAASGGYIDIMKLMIEKGANDYNDSLINAAFIGHSEIVSFLLNDVKFEYNYNMAISSAGTGGHEEIVKELMEDYAKKYKGKIDYYASMSGAVGGGNRKIIDFIFTKKVGIYDKELIDEILKGPEAMANLMKEEGRDIYNPLLGHAAYLGGIKRVDSMLAKGADDYNEAMARAAEGGHINIVRLMIEKGANDYDEALQEAFIDNHEDIAELMIEKGANYRVAMSEAIKRRSRRIIDLIFTKKVGIQYINLIDEILKKPKVMVELMEKEGDDINKILLGYAAYLGDKEILNEIIDRVTDEFDRYNEGVREAARGGHMDIVDFLIERGGYAGCAISGASLGGHLDIVKSTMRKVGTAYKFRGDICCAAEGGNIDIVKFMLKRGDDSCEAAMVDAAREGHIGIVNLALEKEATYFLKGSMLEAARFGHIEVVKLLLKKGADNYRETMREAAEGGHIEIVELMILKMENEGMSHLYYEDAMLEAAKEGHMDIVKLILEKGEYNYDCAMSEAARGGHMDIVRLMLDKGATNYNFAMEQAIWGSCEDISHLCSFNKKIYYKKDKCRDIIELMIKKGANNFNEVMRSAALAGDKGGVRLMMRRGADRYNEAMVDAAQGNHIDIVELMLKKGASTFNDSMAKAESLEVVKLMIEKGATNCVEWMEQVGGASYDYNFNEIFSIMLSTYWEQIDENLLKRKLKGRIHSKKFFDNYLLKESLANNFTEIKQSIKYPASSLGVEEGFLLSMRKTNFNDMENLALASSATGLPESLPTEIISLIFKHVNIRSQIELMFLYSNRDLEEEELKKIEEEQYASVKVYKFEKKAEKAGKRDSSFLGKSFSCEDLSYKRLTIVGGLSRKSSSAEYLHEGNIERVTEEYPRHFPLNVRDENGLTMLHKVCYYGHRNKVNFLVNKEALKNMEDKEGKTPLWYAKQGAKDGQYEKNAKFIEWIEMLKEKGFR